MSLLGHQITVASKVNVETKHDRSYHKIDAGESGEANLTIEALANPVKPVLSALTCDLERERCLRLRHDRDATST